MARSTPASRLAVAEDPALYREEVGIMVDLLPGEI